MFKKIFLFILTMFITVGLTVQSANANLDTSDVYVPDSDVLNMTIVDADGNILQKVEEKIQTRSTSRKGCVAPLGFEVTCNGNVGIFGRPGHRVHYTWYTHHDTYTTAAVRVKGYRMNGRLAGREYWLHAGMGTSGSRTIDWGNVLSIKSIKARGLNVPAGSYVIWH